MKTVLFLCTGNYYRSRFADELFDHHAVHRNLGWRAVSRALAIERGRENVGPISAHTLEGLAARGLVARRAETMPRRCSASDLGAADLIVALDEREHRPLVEERFSEWAGRIEYWSVPDLPLATPDQALSAIEVQVLRLVARLSTTAWTGEIEPPWK